MSTEMNKTVLPQHVIYEERHAPHVPYTNGNVAKLYRGQEVVISDSNECDKRTVATTYSIGVLQYDVEPGEVGVVGINKRQTLAIGVIKGSAVVAGNFVVPNGNVVINSDGELTGIEYVVAATGNLSYAMAKTGASADGTFTVEYLGYQTVVL